ncbi:MAG: hypothetical protein C0598_13510, partial [Marinilabiliales bacterium]
MRALQYILLVIFLFTRVIEISAQRKLLYDKAVVKDVQTKFINLNISDGLSNDIVNDIIQDNNGLMWICTMDGINSYNGSEFTVYQNIEGDTLSPNSNEIFCVEVDSEGSLYFGTSKGICKYIANNNKFQQIALKGNELVPEKPYIRQILYDGNKGLWIEILEGALLYYNLKTQLVERYFKHDATNQPYYRYHPMYYDHDSTLWIGGRGLDPGYLKKGDNELKYIYSNASDYTKKRENDVASFFEDSKGNFWISALDGIYLLDRETEKFQKFFKNSTWDIYEDYNGHIWFSGGSGVFKYIPDADQMIWFFNDKDNPGSIS